MDDLELHGLLVPIAVGGEKTSEEHCLLDREREWIKERLGVGWQPITVFEEPPGAQGGVSRSSFYRYLKRAGLDKEGRHYRRVVPEIVHQPGEALLVDWGKLCDAYNPATGKKGAVWAFVGVSQKATMDNAKCIALEASRYEAALLVGFVGGLRSA